MKEVINMDVQVDKAKEDSSQVNLLVNNHERSNRETHDINVTDNNIMKATIDVNDDNGEVTPSKPNRKDDASDLAVESV